MFNLLFLKSMTKKDVVIVGAGPAGIFCGLGLIFPTNSAKVRYNVSLFDKGKGIEKRFCPGNNGKSCSQSCNPCSQMCGFGGAGAFSDGKLNISTTALGDVRITDYISMEDFVRLVQLVDQRWVKYGAPGSVYGSEESQYRELAQRCNRVGLELIVGMIRHVGTDITKECLTKMQFDLANELELRFESEVDQIFVDNENGQRLVKGVKLINGKKILADYVVVCPGREGKGWFERECERLELDLIKHPVDIGVRVEVPAEVMNKFTDVLYEPKIFCRPNPFNDQTRTFCVCPRGEVTLETITGYDGKRVTCVNGHSFEAEEKKTKNTNFALLVKSNFTEPFDKPTQYATVYAEKINMLAGGGVLVQRLGDILAGRRSTPERMMDSKLRPSLMSAVPGDVTSAVPYRHMTDIIETLRTMEKVMPGIFSMTDTFLYGPEIKLYSSTPRVSNLEVCGIRGLFVGGDGAGISRNLVHAAVCGLKIAEEIYSRNLELKKYKEYWGGNLK